MLSVRPPRCHSDTVCFSQVLLGNHSSPKPACLSASHRTRLLFPSQQSPCPFLSLPFVCSLLHLLFEHSQRAQAGAADPVLHCEQEKKNKPQACAISEFLKPNPVYAAGSSAHIQPHASSMPNSWHPQVILFGSDQVWPYTTWVSIFCYWLLCYSLAQTHTDTLLFRANSLPSHTLKKCFLDFMSHRLGKPTFLKKCCLMYFVKLCSVFCLACFTWAHALEQQLL